ncbi:MAG TPA: TolC family protein [Thermoanaerobaculia bacterium]|nr:TolC family protein [Thermoanaerobaculia bacterium]
MRKIVCSFFTALTVLAWGGLLAQGTPPPGSPRVLLLSLEDALRIASGESETVWVAQGGAMRAVGSELAARSGLFPQLSGSASYTRTLRSQFSGINFGGGGSNVDLPFGRTNQYSLGLNLSQLVFDGGQTVSRLRASRARRRSSEIDVDAARAETLLDTTSAYFDALLSERLVQIAEASLAQQEELLRQTEVARQVGDKAEFDVLRARVARDNQVPAVLRSRTQRQEFYWRLKQLLNVPLEDELRLTTGIEDLPERFATPANAPPEDRAPVRQANEEVQANQALLTGARAERLPSVSFSSRYNPVAYPPNGVPDFADFREDWTVTLSLSIPILTGGRLRGDELVARGNLSQARARLQQTREAAELDSRTAANDLADAEATLKATTSTVEQARRAFEIAGIRFREGIGSQIELSDARIAAEQSEVNRAQALRNVQVARARLALLRDLPLSSSAAFSQGLGAGQQGSGGVAAPGSQMTQPGTTGTTGTSGTTGIPGVTPGVAGTGGVFP